MKFELEITEKDLAVIGHVVVDPVQWARDAFLNAGAGAIVTKIAKYRPGYEADKITYGADYKNRAQREAVKKATLEAQINVSKKNQ